MCGIYGIWSPKISVEYISRMGEMLHHRGPDDQGLFHQGKLFLGHKRLSIIDLSKNGKQPMTTKDGQFTIVFNGEIYNYKKLRETLEKKGYVFFSKTDTEVLLKGYQEWGEEVLLRIYGMFAFAIWECGKEELTLARDATGIKPLFYIQHKRYTFAFASEIKAFKALPDIQFSPDLWQIHQYLEFGYVWERGKTLIQGIQKLPPGSLIKIRDGKVKSLKRWWIPPVARRKEHLSEKKLDNKSEELYSILSKVIQEHLVADVPVGLLLSGGLDSSVLASIASRYTNKPLRTISIGFSQIEDERIYGRQVAEFIGSKHREIILTPEEVLAEFQESIWYYDDLFWDTGFISSLLIYRYCRAEGLKVILVGEGADEIFGGYRNFQLLGDSWTNYLPDFVHRYLFYRQYSSQNFGKFTRKHMSTIKKIFNQNSQNWFSTVRHYELGCQIPNNLNMKVDRASMANSVEARVPFQDRRIIEYICNIPSEYFLCNGINKFLLRHMARKHNLLPKKIINRPKLGMMMPGRWLTENKVFYKFAKQVICSPSGWANKLGLKNIVDCFFAGKEKHSMRFFRKHVTYSSLVWRLFVLELWSKKYL